MQGSRVRFSEGPLFKRCHSCSISAALWPTPTRGPNGHTRVGPNLALTGLTLLLFCSNDSCSCPTTCSNLRPNFIKRVISCLINLGLELQTDWNVQRSNWSKPVNDNVLQARCNKASDESDQTRERQPFHFSSALWILMDMEKRETTTDRRCIQLWQAGRSPVLSPSNCRATLNATTVYLPFIVIKA